MKWNLKNGSTISFVGGDEKLVGCDLKELDEVRGLGDLFDYRADENGNLTILIKNPEAAVERIKELSVEVGELRAQIIERNNLIESLLEQLEKPPWES